MKKILIAYDGSPGADAALADLERAGLPEKCETKVLAIADVWLPPDPSASESAFPEGVKASRVAARQSALEAVAEARAVSIRGAERLQLLFPAWNVHFSSAAESPAWGIMAEARRWQADLIVIGSHGRSPLEKFFLGSVSYKVAAEAHCSVRVVRHRAHNGSSDPALRILIASDGSPDADAAYEEALARNWPEDTKFQILTVVDPKFKTAAIADAGLALASTDRIEDWVGPVLAKKAELFRKKRFEVATHILEGDPKLLLLRHSDAWKADCIFLGARGQQHGDRLYLGTVASAITSRAHCTVEVVRPGTAARAPRAS